MIDVAFKMEAFIIFQIARCPVYWQIETQRLFAVRLAYVGMDMSDAEGFLLNV